MICFGRNNLALTVYVPYDCKNSCHFCSSKRSYKTHLPSISNVKYQMKRVFGKYNYPIKDVVFTGGEPMANIEVLRELIDLVPSGCNIYINTTFTNKNLLEFVHLVNSCDQIEGVNISRHLESYEEDRSFLCDIASDEKIELIHKSVRINCVVKDQDLSKVIERWKGTRAQLYFRKDYNIEQDAAGLHNPYSEVSKMLIDLGFSYKSHTQCNVCDTTVFERDGQIVAYHKGLKNSSIERGDSLEVNDLIIDQSGLFSYDWSTVNMQLLADMENQYERTVSREKLLERCFNEGIFNNYPSCGSGVYRC